MTKSEAKEYAVSLEDLGIFYKKIKELFLTNASLPDLSNYVKQNQLTNYLPTSQLENLYVKKSDLENFSGGSADSQGEFRFEELIPEKVDIETINLLSDSEIKDSIFKNQNDLFIKVEDSDIPLLKNGNIQGYSTAFLDTHTPCYIKNQFSFFVLAYEDDILSWKENPNDIELYQLYYSGSFKALYDCLYNFINSFKSQTDFDSGNVQILTEGIQNLEAITQSLSSSITSIQENLENITNSITTLQEQTTNSITTLQEQTTNSINELQAQIDELKE